jgi:hypothetical protein
VYHTETLWGISVVPEALQYGSWSRHTVNLDNGLSKYCVRHSCLLVRVSFFASPLDSSSSFAFFPHRSHLPSSVMDGSLGASPPHRPHLGILITSSYDWGLLSR